MVRPQHLFVAAFLRRGYEQNIFKNAVAFSCVEIDPTSPDYNLNITDEFQFNFEKDVEMHWMTITQLIEDEIVDNRWLNVQSWGDVYYLDFDEWLKYQDSTKWDGILIISDK